MNSLKDLSEARMLETNATIREYLMTAERDLREAIKTFSATSTADNMINLNGAWITAVRAFKVRTPSGPDSPVGGAVEWRKAA